MNSDSTVLTCTVSCLGTHMEVSQKRTEKIRFHLVYTVHTVMKKKKKQIWDNFTWILNIANIQFDTIMQEKIHLNNHIAIMTNDENKNPKYCFMATKKIIKKTFMADTFSQFNHCCKV